VVITDSLGCTQSASGTVGSVGGPPVSAGADVTITSGSSTVLTGTSSVGASYSWSPSTTVSCDTCASTVASPTQTTTYTLTVTIGGCTSQDTVTVFVEVECGELFVPNVFSPNGDGANDVLKIYGNCITDLEFAIFDRWGEKVFETTDPAIVWDGRYQGNLLDAAVFVYYLSANVKGEPVKKHGNITLVK
jgi:gliding motility-associated-like protein